LHRLETVFVSVDSSVIVDFHLTGNLSFLEEVFGGRMLMSDFVEEELGKSQIRVLGSEIVTLTKDEEWAFFAELRKRRRGLGPGELGAITVAKFQNASLLTNDRQARQTADEIGMPVSGAIGVLEYGVEVGKLTGPDAVRILEEMIREGAWIAEDLLEMFRRKMLEATRGVSRSIRYSRKDADLSKYSSRERQRFGGLSKQGNPLLRFLWVRRRCTRYAGIRSCSVSNAANWSRKAWEKRVSLWLANSGSGCGSCCGMRSIITSSVLGDRISRKAVKLCGDARYRRWCETVASSLGYSPPLKKRCRTRTEVQRNRSSVDKSRLEKANPEPAKSRCDVAYRPPDGPSKMSHPHPPVRAHSERGIQALPLACQVLPNWRSVWTRSLSSRPLF
jgi:predicted nucleic acid-binding protein